jgi:Ni/Co efflux regulator RcnB
MKMTRIAAVLMIAAAAMFAGTTVDAAAQSTPKTTHSKKHHKKHQKKTHTASRPSPPATSPKGK